MYGHDNTAMKVIVIVGIMTMVLLFIVALVMKRSLKPDESERVRVVASESPFDQARAWRDLEFIVGLGPRPAGSEKAAALRQYIARELEGAGLSVREHAFEAQTPVGAKSMVNLITEIRGSRGDVILLTNHYDTKQFDKFAFVGANDGGSTTAWMLEMARALKPRAGTGCTIWLAWLDGEESFGKWTSDNSLYGSRALVAHLKEKGELSRIRAMINVDMIGDAYLCIHRDPDAPSWLLNPVWDTARRFGYMRHFSLATRKVEDDHVPFREAGVPALEIIDFSYGGSMMQHALNWHTAQDTLDKVRAESLKAVGDVIYHSLSVIEAQLDRQGKQPAP
jgi:hypothetical protein